MFLFCPLWYCCLYRLGNWKQHIFPRDQLFIHFVIEKRLAVVSGGILCQGVFRLPKKGEGENLHNLMATKLGQVVVADIIRRSTGWKGWKRNYSTFFCNFEAVKLLRPLSFFLVYWNSLKESSSLARVWLLNYQCSAVLSEKRGRHLIRSVPNVIDRCNSALPAN